MEVASLIPSTSTLLVEQSPIKRARANAQISVQPSVVSNSFLSSASAVEAQSLGARLSPDFGSALANASRARAAYETSAALVTDAALRNDSTLIAIA